MKHVEQSEIPDTVPGTFTEYLQQKKYSPVTVGRYVVYNKRFLTWLANENSSSETFIYNDVLGFMRHCHQNGTTKRTVHYILCIVRHYCNYLISEGKRNDNPAAGVFIKGLVRKLPTNLLSTETMEELFKQYSIQLNVDSSKKIIFGLMVYQGLSAGEIMGLQRCHIKINEGKIFIKGTKRSNERLLELKGLQVAALQNYLDANKFKEGYLFVEKGKQINNRIQHMLKQLRQLNPAITNPQQIRSSVISEWLRKNNLRQVQYMAGHKYVSSTERYQTNNLDDLQNELQQHHPMK